MRTAHRSAQRRAALARSSGLVIIALVILGGVLYLASPYTTTSRSRSTTAVSTTTFMGELLSSQHSSCAAEETQEAVDPTDRNHIYVAWMSCLSVDLAFSTDGGASFSTPSALYRPKTQTAWDPAIAISQNGTLFVSYMISSIRAPEVAVSSDRGATFRYANVSVFSSPIAGDRPFIAATNDVVYVTWDYIPHSGRAGYDLAFARSTDGGRSWSSPKFLNSDFPTGGVIEAAVFAEPRAGRIDIAYNEGTVVSNTLVKNFYLYYTSSTDGGRTWSTRQQLAFLDGSLAWWIQVSSISSDAAGNIYVGYDIDTPGTKSDAAMVAYSTNDGTSWTSIQVNPDTTSSGSHFQTVVAGAEGGVVFAAYVSNATGDGQRSYVRRMSISSSGVSSSTLFVSDPAGANVWPGDTIGLSYLGNGFVFVTWSAQYSGHGMSVYGSRIRLSP